MVSLVSMVTWAGLGTSLPRAVPARSTPMRAVSLPKVLTGLEQDGVRSPGDQAVGALWVVVT